MKYLQPDPCYGAQSPENFTFDPDGNLKTDGKWTYTWDAENRLATMETQPAAVTAGVVRQKLEFAYDAQGRRIQKKVSNWNGTAYVVASDTRFAYDGWNMLAELNGLASNAVVRTYVWGLDLSGSSQGAGGVGGLLAIANSSATYAPTFDGNGNIVSLINAADGTTAAEYAYGPFGEVIKAAGAAIGNNPFGFSTKYQDAESGFMNFGYRFYIPSTGRFINRDLLEEDGGVNLFAFVENSPTTLVDPLGLALYAFDGTNNDGFRDEPKGNETNVFILFKGYIGNSSYLPGVGTHDGVLNFAGKAFGYGGQARERTMLGKAGEYLDKGDKFADIIGFSRGAAQARDFANKLHDKYPCITIRWMGLFDTVASEGLPNDVNVGYNLGIPKGTGSVLHITAGAERRKRPFALTSIRPGLGLPNANPDYREEEMPDAVHSDVGGFYGTNRGLANQSLQRMWRDGIDHKVPFGPLDARYTNVTPNGPNDSRWINDKLIEFFTGKRVRKIYYHP